MVGMVMICYGITNTLGSLTLGYMLKITGRTFLLVLGKLATDTHTLNQH